MILPADISQLVAPLVAAASQPTRRASKRTTLEQWQTNLNPKLAAKVRHCAC
jgi:hypothetical protein